MTNTLKEFHFTDEQIDVLLEALIWTIDNGNYSEQEYECAHKLYETIRQSVFQKWLTHSKSITPPTTDGTNTSTTQRICWAYDR